MRCTVLLCLLLSFPSFAEAGNSCRIPDEVSIETIDDFNNFLNYLAPIAKSKGLSKDDLHEIIDSSASRADNINLQNRSRLICDSVNNFTPEAKNGFQKSIKYNSIDESTSANQAKPFLVASEVSNAPKQNTSTTSETTQVINALTGIISTVGETYLDYKKQKKNGQSQIDQSNTNKSNTVETLPSSNTTATDNSTKSLSTNQVWLGIAITDINEKAANQLNLSDRNGALITKIEANSPAANAGLRTGDVVQQVETETIFNSEQLMNIIRQQKPEQWMSLTLIRNSEPLEVKIKLSKRVAERLSQSDSGTWQGAKETNKHTETNQRKNWMESAQRKLPQIINQDVAHSIQKITHPTGKNPFLLRRNILNLNNGIMVQIDVGWNGGILGSSYITTVHWLLSPEGHVSAKVMNDTAQIIVAEKNKKILDDYFREMIYPVLSSNGQM